MDSNKIGINGEKAVNEIAFNTYLKYWCFPNPKDELGNKKEICDLLICFKNHLIILSIKNYSFTGNYERYFRSTLDKAVSQIQGAEKKLSNNSGITFNHPETGGYNFDYQKFDSVHRIVVNINNSPLFHPGGLETKNNKFCHIFNLNSFFGLVNELNTIPDFIGYLVKREQTFKGKEFLMMLGNEEDWNVETNEAFQKYNSTLENENKSYVLFSGSELDLLADYFFNERKFNKNFYSSDVQGALFKMDGKWNNYLSRKEVELKKKEDKLSYFVDEFVKREVLYRNNQSNIKIATELLSLSRFERRIFAQTFFEFYDRYKNENEYFVARRYGTVNNIVFVMVIHGSEMTHEHVIFSMQLAAEGFCVWEGYKSKKIVLIGTSNKLGDFKFGMIENIEPFTKEKEEEIISNLKILNWFQNMEKIFTNFKEYPE